MASLLMFTIYESPLDYPGKFVVRKHKTVGGGLLTATQPTAVVDTLEQARAAVPAGMWKIPRDEGDELQIVETWI